MLQQASIPKPDIGRKLRFLPQLGGPRRNIAITYSVPPQTPDANTAREIIMASMCKYGLLFDFGVRPQLLSTERRRRLISHRLCCQSL